MKRSTGVIVLTLLLTLSLLPAGNAFASTLIPQTALPGDCIPQFAMPLPVFGPGYNAALPRVDAQKHPYLTVTMKEVSQQVLPNFAPTTGCPSVTIQPTRVWAYETSDTFTKRVLGPALWPAVTVETKRYVPTVVTYVNTLPSFDPMNPTGPGMVQGLITTDQSIHWADPMMLGCMMMNPPVDCTVTPGDACCQSFTGPPPAVAHLHGGESPSAFDGGPEQWFTPDGRTGKDYRTLGNPGPGKAVYKYDNFQEPGTPWFHDHALGATRTNVYSGMAAFYFIRDPQTESNKLPSGPYEIEMAFQDRQFDTNSQLFFPDGSGDQASNLNGPPPNPDMHPFWIPEFIGDVAIVNGAPWPYLTVEPRRYRFRVLDGSNARFYNLSFGNAPVYVIGADDNYLAAPVRVNSVFMAPGERYDIIVDFTGLAGQSITATNDAPIPFPDGLVPGVDQPGMAGIMQFRVTLPLIGRDRSCNPAIAGACGQLNKIPRLTDGMGNIAPGVKISKVRQLVLKEVQGPGGPIEVFVNNTKWDGLTSPNIAADFPTNGISELPRVGSTELWEIINLTMDAHPMHTHLAQFQILNRQAYSTDEDTGYLTAWSAAFGTGPIPLLPGCVPGDFCPGYGPPLPYNTPNADGAIGGNPAVSPYLTGTAVPPAAEEFGWKDTAKAHPGEVLRILVRWAPTDSPVSSAKPGLNLYTFDPTKGPGYVWHCHIIDHEDNEMMRPYLVTK
jgi:spore coat protein A